jgi:hypothetical protein
MKALRSAVFNVFRLGATPMLSGTIMSALQGEILQRGPGNDLEGEDGPSPATSALLAKIASRDCPNKKAALKSIISAVIASDEPHGDSVQVYILELGKIFTG